MTPQTIILHRHWIGLAGIWLAGIGIAALLAATAYALMADNQSFAYLLLAAAVLDLLATLIQSIVYQMSYFRMDATGITAENWLSIFAESEATCEWRNIQDVDHKEPGLLSQLFDYGTLYVQTAGTERNLKLTMVPNVDHWAVYIQQQADTATTRVTEVP